MMNKIVLLLLIISSFTFSMPIEQNGFIEGKMSMVLDTLQESGSRFIHQERINWGIRGSSDFADLNYRMNFGGVFRGNSALEANHVTPEYGFRASARPVQSMDLSMFSYSRLRNPMQILQDSLEYKEFVHGLKLGAQLSPNSRFSIASGLKSREIKSRDSLQSNRQFFQLHLDQKIAGMQFRFTGETDIWEGDSEEERQSTLASFQWYGSPISALRWTATNSVYMTDDYSFWRISHRMNYDISGRQKIWAIYNQGDFAYGSQSLIRKNYDLRYRFQWKPTLGFDLAFKGNRVSVSDSLDIFHWRSYGVSSHWRVGKMGFARGNFDVGFKESYLYGRGLDMILNASEFKQVFANRLLAVKLRDDLSAEMFMRFDESEDARYDIRHQFRITTEFLPESRFRFGNHLKIHNHFGSDLDFSPDTLRNAVIDELYLKKYSQRANFSVYFRTIMELIDPDQDLQFNLNTRYYRQLSRTISCNFMSLYRFESELHPDYLWLSTALKYHTNLFSFALEFQSGGPPDNTLQQDSQVWLRFVRQI